MTKDEADALLAALQRPGFARNLDPWNHLEAVWTEQVADGWDVVIHAEQGPHRYEHRFRVLEDEFGNRDVAATEIADWIYHVVLQEPLGDGSSCKTRPFPLTPAGRYLRQGWV